MALSSTQELSSNPGKAAKVWLGEGLGTISKRTYERMMRWEFVDLGELRPRTVADRATAESETEKLVVLPGFEVTQARKRPINNIVTWVQCFGRYTAAMAKRYPECTPGFMSHMLAVLKAHGEVEGQAWRLYDEVYREKMASTGVRRWPGVDVQVYQETCGGHPGRRVEMAPPLSRATGGGRPSVCWQYNEGTCSYGRKCKFPHVCEGCRGGHPKRLCPNGRSGGSRQQ